MSSRSTTRRFRSAHILVFTLAILSIMFVLTSVALALVQSEQTLARRSYTVKQARSIAEAGVDYAIRQLNENTNYAGDSDLSLGQGVFSVAVTGTGFNRKIESTGYVPSSSNPVSSRKVIVEATLDTSNAQFFYGIQVDGGGLTMAPNAGVVGNVYSNGDIVGANGAFISENTIVAGGIAADPSLEWATNDVDQFFATSSGNRDIAQSFIATTAGLVTKVSVFVGKVGNPTDNFTLRIVEDNPSGGKPSNNDIASTPISAASVGTTPSWVSVSFPTPPTVTAGTKYWIVLDNSNSSGVNYWNWRQDSSNGYADNRGIYTSSWSTSSASWHDTGGDLDFRVWIGGTSTKIQDVTVGSSTTGEARANLFVNTTVHDSACPNQYCIIDNPPQQALPLSDGLINDWKDDAVVGGTQGSYTLSANAGSLGPRKIEGNLTVDNNAILTVTGTIYVTGNIILSNNCTVKLDPGYGSGSGIIIADGTITISNNCIFQGAGVGSYTLLLTTIDAKNSVSMNISNNSLGVVYYAAKSRIAFANNSQAKEATAWGIDLSNNAVITYESGLSSLYFSGGPGAGWTVIPGSWREIRSF